MRILESIHNYDLITFGWCLRRKHRELAVKISRVISFTANGPLYVAVGVAFIFLQHWDMVKLMAFGFFIERSLYFIFKTLFKRNRPTEAIPGYISEIEPSDKFSFPSGHTSGAFLFAGCMLVAFPWAIWFLLPWACSVGVARVMLGVHFPTDILAGALLGSTICTVLIGLLF